MENSNVQDFGTILRNWQEEQRLRNEIVRQKYEEHYATLTDEEKQGLQREQEESSRRLQEMADFDQQRQDFIAAKLAAAKELGNQNESKEAKAQSIQDALAARRAKFDAQNGLN
jgi:hypothetical protein